MSVNESGLVPDLPVQLRRPSDRSQNPADLLHLAVWNNDPLAVRHLVENQGIHLFSISSLGVFWSS